MDIVRITRISVLTSLGLCLYFVESFLPALPVPGASLGLASIVTIVALYTGGIKDALSVAVLRATLASLLSGKFLGIGFAMSLSGALFSVSAMIIVYYFLNRTPIIVNSILGGIIHNLTQLFIAYCIIGSGVLYLLPLMIFFGGLAGWVTGKVSEPVVYAISFNKNILPKTLKRVPQISIGILLLLTVSITMFSTYASADTEKQLVIEQNNEEVLCLDLISESPSEYISIDLGYMDGFKATVEIRGDSARILEMPDKYCHEHICSNTGWISNIGESAICLPNKLIIKIIEK